MIIQYLTDYIFKYKYAQNKTPNNVDVPQQNGESPYWNQPKVNQWAERPWSGASPDGATDYYDPTPGHHTHIKVYPSGEIDMVGSDGHHHNIPGIHKINHGADGSVEANHGIKDNWHGHHVRNNYQGDTYDNIKGVAHKYVQGGEVSYNAGNSSENIAGNKRTRMINEDSTWNIGVGPGDGSDHDNGITISNKRIYIKANSQGDIWIQTKSNSINIDSGTDINMTAKGNINLNAGTDIKQHAGNNWQVDADSKASMLGTISSHIASPGLSHFGVPSDFGIGSQEITPPFFTP